MNEMSSSDWRISDRLMICGVRFDIWLVIHSSILSLSHSKGREDFLKIKKEEKKKRKEKKTERSDQSCSSLTASHIPSHPISHPISPHLSLYLSLTLSVSLTQARFSTYVIRTPFLLPCHLFAWLVYLFLGSNLSSLSLSSVILFSIIITGA